MRRIELEGWVLAVLDRVVAGQPNEDVRVELKSEWPTEPSDTARRIGAHANVAHGEPILWVIGADENARAVPGVPATDLTAWFGPIRAEFDGVPPEPTDLVVPYKGVAVVALLFETDRAPYVVRNPQFGTAGHKIAREVPWRAQTGLRSAMREDLVRLLVPELLTPEHELLKASGSYEVVRESADHYWKWNFPITLYLIPKTDRSTLVPYHRMTADIAVRLRPAHARVKLPLGPPRLDFVRGGDATGGVVRRPDEFCIERAGALVVVIEGRTEPLTEIVAHHPVRLHLTFPVIRAALPIVVEIELEPDPAALKTWKLPKS